MTKIKFTDTGYNHALRDVTLHKEYEIIRFVNEGDGTVNPGVEFKDNKLDTVFYAFNCAGAKHEIIYANETALNEVLLEEVRLAALQQKASFLQQKEDEKEYDHGYKINEGAKVIAGFSGADTSYASKWGEEPNGNKSVYKKWFFDVQWSDCPDEVEQEVIKSWQDYELGNDRYFWTATLDNELFEQYPLIYFWLEHQGVQKGEEVIIHWWW